MPTNDFKPFATGAGANVMSQADWVALAALATGFQSGKASSAQVNKAIRQASFIASALAQYTADKSGLDVLDNGDISGFISKMQSAFGKDFQTLDATLSALAGLATGTDTMPYFSGIDAASQTPLTQTGRDILAKTTAAAVLSYISGAPLASPVFTGDPKAPTPPVGDNDTSIATTAFVAAAVAALGSAAHRSVGNSANQIPDMSYFQFSITGDNGYFLLPNGIIRQFGYVANAAPGAVTNVTFPIPFPTKRLEQGFSVVSPSTGVTVQSVLQFIAPSLTGFGMANIAAITSGSTSVGAPVNTGFYWWAEGY